ncbi:MAG TPA: hypothetical protein VK973_17440 [Arenicellales bacterium]|nr:hypothetical protein [Arenicellales bacterium]
MIEFNNITPERGDCPGLINRLERRDPSLWSEAADIQKSIGDRLGWLDAAGFMDRHSGRILDFAQQVKREEYQQAVLLGMGGSSLAPEVYAALFGNRSGALPLTVLDTTSPDHVARITAQCEGLRTLFIVSSKSGTTAETSALDAHFYEWARSRRERAADHFVAITDPGSPLDALASERGYRETFLNPADIGGRFSALSFFGLVPAALAGADLDALRRHVPESLERSPLARDACILGKAVGSLARGGRDKLTLVLGEALAPLAPWVEQLIDESTGKDGRGIVVIAGEQRLEPEQYSRDRMFVVVDTSRESIDGPWLDAIVRLGHPVARWRLETVDEIGAEFYRWEIATAIVGRELGINPFDEPDVNASKQRTRALLEQPDRAAGGPPQAPARLSELLEQAGEGDYLALLAFVPPSEINRARLERLRTRLTDRTGRPCTLGFGPRYLHSSGQLHKGGPDRGLFIVLTRRADADLPIPGQRHGFSALFQAQALGDLEVLRQRGRRVVHVQLSDDREIETLGDEPGAT